MCLICQGTSRDHLKKNFDINYVIWLNRSEPVTQHGSHVKGKEGILISRDELILSKNETSLPSYLFDWSLPYKIIF